MNKFIVSVVIVAGLSGCGNVNDNVSGNVLPMPNVDVISIGRVNEMITIIDDGVVITDVSAVIDYDTNTIDVLYAGTDVSVPDYKGFNVNAFDANRYVEVK